MPLYKILILAIIQGLCELLPVSSSAHVIFAEKLMGLDPTSPEMTLLLVMLHTGTMLSVIAYFWKSWRSRYFASMALFRRFAADVLVATAFTGVIGLALLKIIEKLLLGGDHAEIEQLFGNTTIIASGLAVVGIMIIVSAKKQSIQSSVTGGFKVSSVIGAVQGLCLPFRGFSRSGSTISTGLLLGLRRDSAEDFSFALAVVLTPAVVAKEAYRFLSAKAVTASHATNLVTLVLPDILGLTFSFVAGLVALRWLSRWLETDRWGVFGYYCLFASAVVFVIG